MRPTDIFLERQKFPSPGECIYCGACDVELTDEHIVPFSLGGNVSIEKASCKQCAEITSRFELDLARKVLLDYRAHAGIQTRRPKQRPKTLPARVVVSQGQEQHLDLPIADHPYFVPMPVWGMPGLLIGAAPRSTFEVEKVQVYYGYPPHIRQVLGLGKGESAEIKLPEFKIDSLVFARAIAKIAYCQAVARYGVRGFRRLVMPDLILGRYPQVPHFVGAPLEDPPPPGARETIHMIDLREVEIGRMRLIVGSVRLFAHSGTEEHGMPIYRVVVGAPK